MRVLNSKNIKENEFTAVTLGNFDGIHLGHKKLISAVKDYAEKYSLKSVVFSFYPHPKSLFNAESFYTIFSPHEKERLVENFDIDVLVQYPFTKEFANMEPEDFAEFIFDEIKCKVLIVGEDYCFGKDRKGNFDLLKKIGDKKDALVIKISSVKDNDIRVSSTLIRECIKNRKFDDAFRLLDKPYFIIGKVIEGNKIGRTIDFPTANIIAPQDKILPPDGVYLTKTMYNGAFYKSLTNIGKNPTVDGKEKTVETYIFDFDKKIYGDEITVCFYDFIREECKFNSIFELKKQIVSDKENALVKFFEKNL